MRAFSRNRLLLGFALWALLAVRALVPMGWMPSTAGGQWIMLCAGTGTTLGWVDADGKLHKDKAPEKPKQGDQCAFSGLGSGLALLAKGVSGLDFLHSFAPMAPVELASAIGQGLAAPPPPKTGPPLLS